ncbi:MAG: polyprenyl synthetase family protein [Pseudomonadota bacterium]
MTSAAERHARLEAYRSRVEASLAAHLPPADELPSRLHAALRYSTLGGGKRIRPALVYATGELLGVALPALDAAAAAVEMIHAYSLIHDDLPAMDNDDLRRGRPTCHRQFDEATAILAGDALQVLAFESLAMAPAGAEQQVAMIRLLATASGTRGMAGGQAIDLAAVGRALSPAEVEQMHRLKTGALIEASVGLAISLAPEIAVTTRDALRRFAAALGLAFQIVDDILDVEGDPSLMGKAVGADQARHKPTYPAAAGMPAARERAAALNAEAQAAIAPLGPQAGMLSWLGAFITDRSC